MTQAWSQHAGPLPPSVDLQTNYLGSPDLSLHLICDRKELDDFINNRAFPALTFQESTSLMRMGISPPS